MRAAAPSVRRPAVESPVNAANPPPQPGTVLRMETVAVVVDVIVTDRGSIEQKAVVFSSLAASSLGLSSFSEFIPEMY
ncbi:MAG TPA: hypothetical protein VNH83_17655 [Bryobacteraceae bacterium]|nr:hypothetical protein [Bryobacteraceae bacterium]